MLHLNPNETWAPQRITLCRVLNAARVAYAQAHHGDARRLALMHQATLLIRIDRLTRR